MDKARRDALENLIADEVEAINGYLKYMKLFNESDKDILHFIIEEEKKHLGLLSNMLVRRGNNGK